MHWEARRVFHFHFVIFAFSICLLNPQSKKSRSIMDMNMHSGEKPFKCKQCNNTFSDAGSLTNHMRSHSNEKPFKCNHWNYASSNVGHLKSHSMRHSNVKPFKCYQCEYSFTDAGDLRNHILTHSGEKPFKWMQTVQSCLITGRKSEDSYEDPWWRKTLQMYPL